MNDLLNPYIAGAPVVEADMFFGRKDVFGWIERSLMGKYVDHILVIHGQRRVGKTSVLKQIPNFLPDRYLQVFFDLQGRSNTTFDRFLWWLAREITRTLKGRHGLTISTPDRGAFAEDPEILFTSFLPEVQSVLGRRMLLLTFDEFDTLELPSIQEKLAIPLIQTLRRMMEMEGFSFIFSIGSSGQKLENMQAAYTDFFKSALYKKISFLDAEDCSQLITKPVEGVLEYEQGAVQRIYEVTAGHPYFTQLVCHELFSVCQKTGVRVIQRPDVDAVLLSVIERGTVNLKFVWDEADDLDKWVLASLARTPECSDPGILAQTLRLQRVRFSEHDLNAALVHMREKDVLTESNHFVVELLRLWMRQNRPLERVREELVEVSPIANRYIEIGEEYWEQGQRENALESFRQALEVDPGNIKARVSVGYLLLEAAEYEAAASAFENALALDREDVAALGGYCKAQLALGDRARDEGKLDQATEFYRAVLVINPEHSAARGRLGVIYRQQAEAKLTAGQDEAALLAFRTALEYSPEDEELTNLVQQVMEEKQAKAIAALSARSDGAQANGNWEAAIAALQDALVLAGRDEALEKKLAGVKAGQRAYLLATLPDKARKQEKDEAWEDATATWQKYLALYPQDQGTAKTALENAQRMGAIQVKYTQALTALEKKDYYRAIELLQQVVQVDPGYKDASRLLASAVGASRKGQVNLLRWGWYALPILFILITAGAFFGLRGRVQLPAITFHQATATPTTTETIATNLVSITPTPSPSPTPYPEWVTDFAEPILISIDDRPPDFEDDFASIKEEPGYLEIMTMSGGIGSTDWTRVFVSNEADLSEFVSGGELHLEAFNKKRFFLGKEQFKSKNFVLQFDFVPQIGRGGDTTDIGIDFRGSEFTENYKLSLEPYHQEWFIGKDISPIDRGTTFEIDPGRLTNVMLIAYENQFAVYLNQEPFTYFQDKNFTGPSNYIYFSSNEETAKVTIDNIKFWDLSTLEGESVALTPTPSPTPYPEWVTDFAEPLMAKIEGQPTQFEDDFSIYKTNWHVPQWKNVNWVDGILELGSWNDEHGIAQLDFDATDYIAQLQFKHVEDRGSLYFKIFLSENNYIYFTLQNEYYYFFHSGGSADPWYLGGKRYWGGMNLPRALTIIRKDEKLAVYLDGLPMDAVSNIPVEKTDFSLGVTSGMGTVEVDNLRLWDLSALKDVQSTQDAITSSPSPTPNQEWVTEFAEPLLAEIEGQPPQFEDDFSIPIQEPGYLMVNGQDADVSEYITDDGKLELEGKLDLSLGSQQFNAFDFAIQYETELYNTENLAEMGIDIFNGLYVFHFNPNTGIWTVNRKWEPYWGGGKVDTGRIEAEIETHIDMLLIAKAGEFTVYMNDEPLTFVQVPYVENDINQIILSSYGDQFHAAIDNVKFWNLGADNISDETNICTVKWSIYGKQEPDPNARYPTYSDPIEAGIPVKVIESNIGSDGKTWYYIEYDQDNVLGLSAWVPESVLSEACKQSIPTP